MVYMPSASAQLLQLAVGHVNVWLKLLRTTRAKTRLSPLEKSDQSSYSFSHDEISLSTLEYMQPVFRSFTYTLLENCLAENVVPKGLKLEKQVVVGEGSNLQETVDKALQKFSLEIIRLVCEDHSQLNEPRGKMLKLEDDLKKHLNDDRKFNNISSEIFQKKKKRKIQLLKNMRKN